MKIRIAGLIKNDVINGQDVCVSIWTQGCPFKCQGCHNPQTWDKDKGIEVEYETLLNDVKQAIIQNGVQRNLSILGGEPLVEYNCQWIQMLIQDIRTDYPTISVYLWTGYDYNKLNKTQQEVTKLCDWVVDGRYVQELKTYNLPFRGSANQKIYYKDGGS